MWENVKGMLALPDDPAQRSAAKQGLLAAGAAMMSGNGNFIGMLGQGLGAGANTYQGALAQQQQAALQRAQQQRWELENKQTQAALAKPALISSALAGVRDPASQGSIASSSAPTQVATATAPTPRRAPPLDASLEGNTVRSFADLPRVDQPPTPQPTATLPPVASPEYLFNYYRQRGDALMGIDVDAAKMQYDLAEKQRRKLKEQRALTVDGKRVLANVFEDGTTQQLDGFAPDLEKLNFQNTGGATVGLDPFTGKPVSTIQNTQSPDSKAADRRADADRRARAERSASLTHGIKELTVEQNEALFGENGAVTTGRLDPNRINSRTAALYANAFLKNPSVDMSKISADIQLSRNANFRTKAMVAETLPEIMHNMVDAGKKLDFSDNRSIGKMQAWAKGEFNDPAYTEYMVQRNDALMTIAGVMRGLGMTDMAHRAEEEASAPTMSPPALDAWLKGQMSSLQPRLDINRRITRDVPLSEKGASGQIKDVKDLPQKKAAPAAYADAEKERRYQEWKRSQGK